MFTDTTAWTEGNWYRLGHASDSLTWKSCFCGGMRKAGQDTRVDVIQSRNLKHGWVNLYLGTRRKQL